MTLLDTCFRETVSILPVYGQTLVIGIGSLLGATAIVVYRITHRKK